MEKFEKEMEDKLRKLPYNASMRKSTIERIEHELYGQKKKKSRRRFFRPYLARLKWTALAAVALFIVAIGFFTISENNPNNLASHQTDLPDRSGMDTNTPQTGPTPGTDQNNSDEKKTSTPRLESLHILDGATASQNGWAIGFENNSYHVFKVTAGAGKFEEITPDGITAVPSMTVPSGLIHPVYIDQDTARIAVSTSDKQGYQTVVFITNDGGQTWETANVSRIMKQGGKAAEYMVGEVPEYMTFSSADEGWLTTAIVVTGGEVVPRGGLYHTTDGGKTWQLVSQAYIEKTLPNVNPIDTITWVAFKDSKNGFTVGQQPGQTDFLDNTSTSLFRTDDGGVSWEKVQIELPVVQDGLLRILKPSFVGTSTIELPVVTIKGNDYNFIIYESTDDGKTWSKTATKAFNASGNVIAYQVKSSDNYWFVTSEMLFINEKGQEQTIELDKQIPNAIEDFQMIGNKAWLVTSTGELYTSTDSGKTWNKKE